MGEATQAAKDFWDEYEGNNPPQPEETPTVEVGGVEIEQDTIDTYITASEKLVQSAQESGVEATALGDATTALATASDTLANTDPANTEAYATAAEAVKTAILNSTTAYEALKLKMESTVTVPVDANTTQASQAIDKLGNKTVTVTVQQKMSGPTYATGTRSAKPGVALVDEEGPELIDTHLQADSLGSPDGARLANLKAGDVVHTADETKEILKRNAVASGKSFSLGTC